MPSPQILRHRLLDRCFHWCSALLIFILLATGLFPVFGLRFNWLPWHWQAGLVLSLLCLLHILKGLLGRQRMAMWIKGRDLKGLLPGKYSLAQKLMHNFIALISLFAIGTGLLMMARIDTPFWERNPYLLNAETWGYVYVLHGLCALLFVSTLMLHIYFALRPEKRAYLRAMLKGYMKRDEYLSQHDPKLWPVQEQDK